MKEGWIVQAYGIPEGAPVVLLHGFMQDASVWDITAQALASTHYVAAPTMVPESEEAASLTGLAEGVYGVVQQAIIRTRCPRVVLVGYSLGGRVALEYARLHPDTLDALVLESASLGPKSESERNVLARRNLAWADQFSAALSMEEVVVAWEGEPLFDTQRSLDAERLADQRRMRLRCSKDALVWLLRNAGDHTMPLADDARSLLASLGIPVLYLAGQHDEKRVEEAARLDALQASNIATTLFACGHNVHLETPVAFSECIKEFLEEVS